VGLRDFKGLGVEFRFRTRSAAFIKKFCDEVGAETVSLRVNEHMPRDCVATAAEEQVLVAEDAGERGGLCRLKRLDEETAEIVLIYLRLDRPGRGYGREAMHLVYAWIGENRPEVKEMVIDTMIPRDTHGFYHH
jgi:hypothetical protein